MTNITYHRNEQLPIIKPNFKGSIKRNGKYSNTGQAYDLSFKNIIKWQLSKNPQKEEKNNEDYFTPVLRDASVVDAAKNTADTIVWLGHASFFIQINGVRMLLDPIFGGMPFYKRYSEFPFAVQDLKNIDYVLLSHGHRDHADVHSLRFVKRYNPDTTFLLPLDLANEMPVLQSSTYQEAAWYQEFKIPQQDLRICFLPAYHWHRRGLTDLNVALWGSFWIKTHSKSIYFAGDSRYDNHYTEMHEVIGDVDIALMPIGAYKPHYIMNQSHMNPEEAALAANELGAKHFVPIHYGTFDLSDEPMSEPLRYIKKVKENGQLHASLRALLPGEAWII